MAVESDFNFSLARNLDIIYDYEINKEIIKIIPNFHDLIDEDHADSLDKSIKEIDKGFFWKFILHKILTKFSYIYKIIIKQNISI